MRFESLVTSFMAIVVSLVLITSMVTIQAGVKVVAAPSPFLPPSRPPPPPMAKGTWGGCWRCWDVPNSHKKQGYLFISSL